ncbi:MAG: metallophosphoesterase [Candidatus Methanoperedens sp.]|nr:metallophosphoesterase [Candidatus Methanoperedens sp.]MCZ7369511.1 metallophosphoesterase [Candidatus Methanoperedens sp.]
MRIITIADTHIKDGPIKGQIPPALIELFKEADLLIHAGDFVSRDVYEELSGIKRLEAVYGNMDEMALKNILPRRKVVDIENIRIGIVHEAALSLQDTTGARYMAKEMGVDILVFGHIHKPVIEKSDVLLVCPGSPTAPRLSEPSAVELIIDERGVSGKVITFEGEGCSAIQSARYFMK